MGVSLYIFAWTGSLFRLFGIHFWDKNYALRVLQENPVDSVVGDSTYFTKLSESYFSSPRFVLFLLHVTGATTWWNLYFLQLIPKVRYAFDKALHRSLGRFLMINALSQAVTGAWLSLTSFSKTFTIISFWLAIGVVYCMYYAWKYAVARDIPKHKYWVIRLVGYLQTIALQRFWLFVLILSYQMGWHGLYPDMKGASLEDCNIVAQEMFDHSFLLAALTAVYLTEWYLAEEQGMVGDNKVCVNSSVRATKSETPLVNEELPLIKH